MNNEEQIIKEVKCIANNTLFEGDSSDYETTLYEIALWEILSLVAPELFNSDQYPELHYIEEE